MHRKLSFGQIAAAWVCCGGLALGAFLVSSKGGRDNPAAAFYAGAHIPGGGGQRPSGPDAEDEPDGHSTAGMSAFPSDPEPVVVSSAEPPAPPGPAGDPKLARHCRYILRQTLVRYSAAVARLAEAGAVSRVREASQ
jgi:hypothetical protein